MAVYKKVPSQVSSGAETFNDNFVGTQITDGTSQLTNTNFELDKVIPQKDSKKFKTSKFSEFLTLSTLKQEKNTPTTQTKTQQEQDSVKFKTSKNDAGKSLFGSLNSRMQVSITNIINNFPAGIFVRAKTPIGLTSNSAINISYDSRQDRTTFNVENSKLFNPFDILMVSPNSSVKPQTNNEVRNFYSSYTKYLILVNGLKYPIISYTELNSSNNLTFIVQGNPFNNSTIYSNDFLIKPIDGIVEEFFNGLDDLEVCLLDRTTFPIYTSTFQVPRTSSDNSNTSLVPYQYNWPLTNDGWNLQISGNDYQNYVQNLNDISTEIDDYKSNLAVRFLASPQLFEFDTDDTKSQSIFQLYGQSFDKVKKYIDNIAYMRNVSYDGVNNLPDILLKNLAENLGLETKRLFDEKNTDDVLYTRLDSTYNGVGGGYNLIDAENDFYRRMLVNLAYMYKTKGTRTSIDFFLKFIGAPEELIRIDEYVYNVTSMPKSFDLEGDIYDVIQGVKTSSYATFDPLTFTYTKVVVTGKTSFNRDGYPVTPGTLLPRRALNQTEDIYFGKGSGWYDTTLNHRSPLILDTENSVLSGRTKTILTKNKDYSFGENYFDYFRTLPGLDTGYGLEMSIHNGKSQVVGESSLLVLNRKNIGVYVSPSMGIDYDIYKKSRDLSLTFGSNSLDPQTGVTFAQHINKLLSEQIKNSNVIRYKKNYITLEDVYRDYANHVGFTPYNFIDVSEFVNKMSPYWMQIAEQLIPSTTQWTGGNMIENISLGRPKYQYIYDCQPKEFIENLYPNFEYAIEEDLETLLGEENNFRGLLTVSGVTYTPVIEIDGVSYSGTTIIVSGTTNTTNSAKLFNPFPMSGCTDVVSNDTINLALICDYKDYLQPDVTKIKTLWVTSLTSLINTINSLETMTDPWCYTGYTGCTQVAKPKLSYEYFTDIDEIEKIKFTSIKYGPGDCSIMDYFNYGFESNYRTSKDNSEISVKVKGTCNVYESGTEECI